MLSKLLKHEFKAIGRVLAPLFAALIAISIILGLTLNFLSGRFPFLNVLLGLVYAAVFCGLIVVSMVIVVQRFYKNLLGNEGYLMLTLPVSMNKQILSKTIAASIWTFLATFVGVLSIFIIVTCLDGVDSMLQAMERIFADTWNIIGVDAVWIGILMVVAILLSSVSGVLKVYAALTIGHQLNSRKLLGSIGVYLLLNVGEMLVTNFILMAGDNIDIMQYVDYSGPTTGTYMFFGFTIVAAIVSSIIYYLVTYILMKERLNLE